MMMGREKEEKRKENADANAGDVEGLAAFQVNAE
jgi:hypothetical protein